MQRSSVRAKLTAITLVFVGIVAAALLVTEISLKISNGVRAYVRGEGLWSRAQKEAAFSLEHYGRTRAELEFEAAMQSLAVNFGDRQAREQMDSPSMDYDLAFAGLAQGGNDPADIPDMIFLFRNFRGVPFLEEAIRTWRAGDSEIELLLRDARALRAEVQAGASDAELEPLLVRLQEDGVRLAELEKNFSEVLSQGARFVHFLLRISSAMLVVVMLGFGIALARRIAAQLRTGIGALQRGTARVAVGDLRGGIEVTSTDELGQLALAFNDMVDQRRNAARVLEQRLQFETMVTRLSSDITRLTAAQVDAGIISALGDIGRFAEVDRSYVFRYDANHAQVSCNHEWCAPGIDPQINRLQALRVSDYPWVAQRILRGEVVHVPRVADLPPEALAERREWQAEAIQSLLLIPMRSGDEIRGYVGFDSVRSEKAWPQETNDLLQIFGEIVANTLTRVQAENELTERNQRLAATVQELERSNAELEEFAYVASHDLKTPLRGINGFVQLLRKRLADRLDPQSSEYIDMTLRSVDQLQSLISGLLELSRVGKGVRGDLPVDARQVLASVEAQIAPIMAEREVSLTHDPLPTLGAAPLELHQLLQNLVGNAIKFQPGPNPRVHVSALREGEFWKFSVRDWGIGIRPEHQSKIFQLFQRLNPVESYEGSGIGLAICRKIVQGHGGRIWVESADGQGATFFFTLPA